MKDRQFIFFSIGVAVLVLVVLVSFMALQINRSSDQSTDPVPSSAPLDLYPGKRPAEAIQLEPEASGQKYQNVTSEDQKQFVRDTMVGNLVSELPYQGRLFKFDYSFATNYFILTYDPQNKAVAEEEFNVYLRSKGVERNWLDYVEVNGALGGDEDSVHGGK